jgi:hypothetical protein
MTGQSRQRRKGVRPHRTLWTLEAVAWIDAYQAQHQIPSFSAAAEALVRLGLQQSPIEVVTPIITSAVRLTLHRELDRLVKLQLYTALEAGIGQRLAGAAVMDLGRVKQDDPARYERIKQAATQDPRLRLRRSTIGRAIAELYAEFGREPADVAAVEPVGGADGDHQV